MAKREAKRTAILQGSKDRRSKKGLFGANATRASAADRPKRSGTSGKKAASQRRRPPALSEKLPFRN
jgi:hypothetical protein